MVIIIFAEVNLSWIVIFVNYICFQGRDITLYLTHFFTPLISCITFFAFVYTDKLFVLCAFEKFFKVADLVYHLFLCRCFQGAKCQKAKQRYNGYNNKEFNKGERPLHLFLALAVIDIGRVSVSTLLAVCSKAYDIKGITGIDILECPFP